MIWKKIKNSEAVSPVVGVMLMLVVTIIIAAVVSGFTGGLVSNTQQAPSAVLEVKLYASHANTMSVYGSYSPFMTVEHKSGDPLPTEDLKIVTYYTNASGIMITGGLDGGDFGNPDQNVTVSNYYTYNGTIRSSSRNLAPLVLSDMNRYDYSYKSSSGWFGNSSAIMRSGDIMCTLGQNLIFDPPFENKDDPGLCYIISGGNESTSLVDTDFSGWLIGTPVEVKILHKPSGSYIFDKVVYIQ